VSRARRLRAEAVLHLVAARLAVAVLPYGRLTRLFELPARRPELDGPERERICLDVRAAVQHATRWVPGSVCLSRAMAAQAMLRRRRITTTLYLGVGRLPKERFGSHAWLKDGDLGVAGMRASGPYRPVASYSGRRS
jgi:Transglutaminase-like superfamily